MHTKTLALCTVRPLSSPRAVALFEEVDPDDTGPARP